MIATAAASSTCTHCIGPTATISKWSWCARARAMPEPGRRSSAPKVVTTVAATARSTRKVPDKGAVVMVKDRASFNRRKFLQTSALGAVAAATGIVAAPSVLRAQGAAVKLGVLHPVSGALSYSGQQGRLGA